VTLDRRDFLVRTGLLVGAGALAAAGCTSDEDAREAGAAAGLDTWEGVRRSFALDKEQAQLASFLLAAHPRPVREDRGAPGAAGREHGCLHPRRGAAARDRGAPMPYLRFGPSIVNSEDDVDRAVAAFAALA
jgi:hypothetical protein